MEEGDPVRQAKRISRRGVD